MYINEIHINLFCCGGHFLSFCNSLELLGLISLLKHFLFIFSSLGAVQLENEEMHAVTCISYLWDRLVRLRTHIVPAGGNTFISCFGYS